MPSTSRAVIKLKPMGGTYLERIRSYSLENKLHLNTVDLIQL